MGIGCYNDIVTVSPNKAAMDKEMRKEFRDPGFIQKSSLSRAVMERIIGAINAGELRVGDRLPPISELAKSLNVGQGSIREALRQMETLGLIRIEHGRGTFVEKVDIGSAVQELRTFLTLRKPDILHLMEARKTLENAIVKLTTERASKEEIAELGKIVKGMKSKIGSPDEFIQSDFNFHMRLAEFSKNPLYPTILDSIRNLFLEEQRAVVKLPSAAERATNYHVRIYQKIRDRSPEGAARAMNRHLQDIENAILKYAEGLSNEE